MPMPRRETQCSVLLRAIRIVAERTYELHQGKPWDQWMDEPGELECRWQGPAPAHNVRRPVRDRITPKSDARPPAPCRRLADSP